MTKKSLPEQFRRNTAVALTAGFFILLWLPTLDYCFRLDRAPVPNENRALARFPIFTNSLAGVHELPAGLENYFRDHFGFRKRLIRWEQSWKHDLFKEAVSPNVITGSDGWLFYSGDHMVEHFQGLKLFTPGELTSWQTLLEKRRDWLARRGIQYVFVVSPDKQSVYPEFLPEWLAALGATNKLDQFVAHMRAHSTVTVLDLRPVLLAAKPSGWVYFKTDTHWNTSGGFAAYQALLRTLAKQLPELREPLPLAAFAQQPVAQAGGDLTTLLGQAPPQPESNATLFTPRPPLAKIESTNALERFPQAWRPRTAPELTVNDQADGKAIVFRDSFANAWQMFLGYHFHEVVYIWQYEWKAEFIEREKPAVVIDEMLERFFNVADPVKLMQNDALP